jgi:hypothetical protein
MGAPFLYEFQVIEYSGFFYWMFLFELLQILVARANKTREQ